MASTSAHWEAKGVAPLTSSQEALLSKLGSSTWPFEAPERAEDEQSKIESVSSSKTEEIKSLNASETQFFSSEDFYVWYESIEADYKSETERKFREYASLLKSHSSSLGTVLSLCDSALAQYDNLRLQQLKVRQKTQSVQTTCERLSREREQLEEFATTISQKLEYFDELKRIGDQVQRPIGEPSSAEDYIESLEKIDDCIAYLASNTQYLDSGTYLTKYRALQHKSLSSVRHFICAAFTKATEIVRSQSQQQATTTSGVELPFLSVNFKSAVPQDLHKVIAAIQLRLSRQDYSRLMHDIQRFYGEKRVEILSEVVEDHLVSCQGSNSELSMLLRLGCAYLTQVTQSEYQLYRFFFPSSEIEGLTQIITPLCTILYEMVRPYFIAMYDISSLCAIIGILKTEIMEDQFSTEKGEEVDAMRPVIEEILADVQERLVYSMQHYIRDEIAYYAPTKEDLEMEPRQREGKEAGDNNGDNNGDNGEEGEGKDKEEEGEEGKNDLSFLYPAVQNTLICLSKTFGCLKLKTFGGLAQECIQYCTDSCIVASQEIAKSSGLLNSQLFLIKNLLALREQISMFEVDFGTQETELDFSHMRDHLRRILRGESSLFALGSSNAIFQMIGSARPRISKTRFDSKKELEKRLKTCCESYIMGVTKLSVDPMLSFITKVTATRVASTQKSLKDHAFATPSKLIEIVSAVNAALEEDLPTAIRKMKRYLESPSTHMVLFKPIKSNIAEAHGQIAHLLESEYDAETIEMVPLMPPPKLMAILDDLS